ncbi:MAG: hypothetical protein M5R36_12540 [Deltaproteobacteria bacterium]|nr:hypothetical protein [Deltaproteobacteria bacterium]
MGDESVRGGNGDDGRRGAFGLHAHIESAFVFETWTRNGRDAYLVAAGALAGAAFLARTDQALFALVVGVAIVMRGDDTPGVRVRRAVRFVGPALGLAAPWLVWNLARFGTIWQDSGRVLMFREQALAESAGNGWWPDLSANASKGLFDYLLRLGGFESPALAVALAAFGFGLFFAVRMKRKPDGGVPATYLLFASGIWIFYILIFRQQKFWYFPPVTAAMALLLARFATYVDTALEDRPYRGAGSGALVLFIALGLSSHLPGVLKTGFHSWQRVYYDAALDLKENRLDGVAADARLGAFNAGILRAFSGRDVTNLDGVVNPRIMSAMRQKNFGAYLRDAKIDVVVDHQKMIAMYGLWASPDYARGFELVRRYETPPFAGDVLALRVLPEAVTP